MKNKVIGSLLPSLIICFFLIVATFFPVTTSSQERNGGSINKGCHCIYGTIQDDESLEFLDIDNVVREVLPPTWDWRDIDGEDWTTPIKNQFQEICGSCWAFGSLAGLESMVKIWENNSALDVDLSEQYMLSCSPGDCGGWYWQQTLNWIKYNGAIPEDCLPYEADDTIPCDDKCPEWRDLLIGIDDYHKVSSNVSLIQSALIEHGPLPATMDVYEDFYPNYTGGVYQYTYGNFVFGHCVTIVGYNDSWGDPDEGYWIVKNSWGTDWGEDGWFRIAYGECRIENGVYYFTGPNYPAEKPEKPSGPTSGKPGEEYTYSSRAIDPDEDTIKYCFDWGDDNSSWSGFVSSGEPVSLSYIWEEKGTYEVKVKVQDEHGLESDWSDPLTVTMPFNNDLIKNPLLLNFLETFHRLYSIYKYNSR